MSRGYVYNKPHKGHRSHRVDRWFYRLKIILMLVIGGGVAGYIVYLAVNK